MTTPQADDQRLEQIYRFFANVLGTSVENISAAARDPDLPSGELGDVSPLMSGVLSLKNQPEFWADAPWRVEPDQDTVPISFHIRDADIQPPGNGPWRLDILRVEQRMADGSWFKLRSFLPAILPGVDDQGILPGRFWVFGDEIPLSDLREAQRGRTVHLRAIFAGSFPPYQKPDLVEIHLETHLAQQGLPLGRAATPTGPRRWFYGDTHYHSAYTDDIKEFGGAIAETRRAGLRVGLDWLVTTDHSCDLDEIDPGFDGQTRWDRLQADLSAPGMSDGKFRFIQGEEITLYNRGRKIVHMLAIGRMDKPVEGSFLPADGGGFQADLARKALERIFQLSSGYSPQVLKQLFGPILTLEEVFDRLRPETLTFAAHPYDVAQVPPAKWDEDDLSHPRLTGHEFWNGRSRCSVKATNNPFSTTAWTDTERLCKSDKKRIKELKQEARDHWDGYLRAGISAWQPGEALPALRPVLIGGSDSHCDFNYHVGWAWDYHKFEVNDNALGKVRTVAYLPDHASNSVPEADEIVDALRRGSCVVTDGPVIEFSIAQQGNVAALGEALQATGDGEIEARVKVHTTPEFGPADQVEVISYFVGQRRQTPRRTLLVPGATASIPLDGTQGYLRVECQTTGPTGEIFTCFTNPIWIRASGPMAIRARMEL